MIRTLALLAAAAVSASLAASPAAAQNVAIVHARAYTMTSAQPVEDATIVIAGTRIVSVAAGGAAPAGARVVDAGGRTVTPGLMNAATQIGLTEVSSASDTTDQSIASGDLGAAFDVQYALNPNSTLIDLARADGVTRALSYPGSSASAPFSGVAVLLHLEPGPDILDRPNAAMFAVAGGSTESAGGSRAAQWQLLRNALDEARAFRTRPPSLAPRDQLLNRLDALALAPVLAGTMPLALMTDRESDIRQAIALARDYALKVIIIGGAEAWRAADALAAAKIPVILDPESNLPTSFDEIGARLDNAALLHRAGVLIGFSTAGGRIHLNYNAGAMLREGAGIAVANGLPYFEALKAISLNPARIWGIGDRYGTLAPGAEADVVIWDGDPLEPSSAPSMLFVGGRQASLETRQTALQRRYAPERMNDPLPPGYR
jgi:imidazolonepropionase-like amidohydrolase